MTGEDAVDAWTSQQEATQSHQQCDTPQSGRQPRTASRDDNLSPGCAPDEGGNGCQALVAWAGGLTLRGAYQARLATHSEREQEVLILVARGLSNTAISENLFYLREHHKGPRESYLAQARMR